MRESPDLISLRSSAVCKQRSSPWNPECKWNLTPGQCHACAGRNAGSIVSPWADARSGSGDPWLLVQMGKFLLTLLQPLS